MISRSFGNYSNRDVVTICPKTNLKQVDNLRQGVNCLERHKNWTRHPEDYPKYRPSPYRIYSKCVLQGQPWQPQNAAIHHLIISWHKDFTATAQKFILEDINGKRKIWFIRTHEVCVDHYRQRMWVKCDWCLWTLDLDLNWSEWRYQKAS